MNYLFVLVSLVCLIGMTSCSVKMETSGNTIKGSGNIITKSIELEDFEKIILDGSFDVYLTYGSDQKIVAEGDDNIIPYLNQRVDDETWHIDLSGKSFSNFKLKIYIESPDIHGIDLSGSGDIHLRSLPTQNNIMQFKTRGSGDVIFEESVSLEDLELVSSGSGDFKGYMLKTKNALINISGSGDVELSVTELLDGRLRGSGNLHYKGNPTSTIQTSGSGNVSKED